MLLPFSSSHSLHALSTVAISLCLASFFKVDRITTLLLFKSNLLWAISLSIRQVAARITHNWSHVLKFLLKVVGLSWAMAMALSPTIHKPQAHLPEARGLLTRFACTSSDPWDRFRNAIGFMIGLLLLWTLCCIGYLRVVRLVWWGCVEAHRRDFLQSPHWVDVWIWNASVLVCVGYVRVVMVNSISCKVETCLNWTLPWDRSLVYGRSSTIRFWGTCKRVWRR